VTVSNEGPRRATVEGDATSTDATTIETASNGEQLPAEQRTQTVVQPSQDAEKSPPYGFYLAALTLVLVSLVALVAMAIFRDVFENATDVTTVLSALFTVVGTVVGTYFGIKTSGDTRDKLQGSIDKANETANRALAELSPDAARQVVAGRLPGEVTTPDVPPTTRRPTGG
jgi:hypothetical protein